MPRDGNEASFRDLFDHAGIGMVALDLEARLLRSNDAFRRIVGYPEEDLLGLDSLKLIHPDDRARVAEIAAEFAAEARERARLERRVVRRDGAIRWVRATVSVVADPGGRPECLLALVEDVTDQHEADGALRHAEEVCASITGSSPDFIMILDLDRRVRFINRTVPGLSVDGVVGTSVFLYVPGRFHAVMESCFEQVIRSREEGSYEVEYVAADGKVHTFVTRVWPVQRNDEVTALTLCATDVTAQRLLEKQLLHAQKMESIGRLAGGIAHDLNNQLSIILGSSELAQRGGGAAVPAVAAELTRIEAAAERAAALTRQLLAFGRKQVMHPRLLGLNSLVASVHGMVDRILGEGIQLRLQLGRVGQIRVDPVQIEQVLLNLVINACDAMPHGGKLVITTEEVNLPLGHVTLPPGRYALLRVADTGIGMTQEVLARVFEPFFTTKEAGKGTGLGLAVAHGIVTQSGGRIEAESEPGAGATFRVYLPVAEGAAEVEARPAPAAPRGNETILVVEDEPHVLDITRRVLEGHGYRVVAASGGEEALAHLARVPGISLLLTDVVMPGMDGHELACRALREHPLLRVVFLSGYDVETRTGAAPHPVLRKPVAAAALATRIREVLDLPVPARA